MSRVFVSCAYRDRAVGARVEEIVRTLGHEPLDDLDELDVANGETWWNAVVDRIEDSEVFLAVVSPAYAGAQSCRLAAKHAAARGLPVVRLDLADHVTGCHPVVDRATPVRFDPDDPVAAWRLADALGAATPPGEAPGAEVPEVPEQPAGAPAVVGEREPPDGDEAPGAPRGVEVVLVAIVLLVAVGLLLIAVVGHRGNGPPAADPAPAQPGAPTTVAPAAAQDLETQVLAAVDAAGSDLLPASSCGSDDGRVTCRAPASNIRAAVLTAYPTRRALYDAYTRAVQRLSGDPAPRNEADCTGQRAEGEVSWNLDHDHRTDISVDAQVLGGLDPASEAAGRLFCTESSDVVQLVWTQDPGLLVTATGQPAAITMAWWDRVHLSLACASGDTGAGCG